MFFVFHAFVCYVIFIYFHYTVYTYLYVHYFCLHFTGGTWMTLLSQGICCYKCFFFEQLLIFKKLQIFWYFMHTFIYVYIYIHIYKYIYIHMVGELLEHCSSFWGQGKFCLEYIHLFFTSPLLVSTVHWENFGGWEGGHGSPMAWLFCGTCFAKLRCCMLF